MRLICAICALVFALSVVAPIDADETPTPAGKPQTISREMYPDVRVDETYRRHPYKAHGPAVQYFSDDVHVTVHAYGKTAHYDSRRLRLGPATLVADDVRSSCGAAAPISLSGDLAVLEFVIDAKGCAPTARVVDLHRLADSPIETYDVLPPDVPARDFTVREVLRVDAVLRLPIPSVTFAIGQQAWTLVFITGTARGGRRIRFILDEAYGRAAPAIGSTGELGTARNTVYGRPRFFRSVAGAPRGRGAAPLPHHPGRSITAVPVRLPSVPF